MRNPVEYETAHIPGSINIPLPLLQQHATDLVATSILASLRFPKARFLAGGVGAGLATAAVTDTCAMSAALSRLPYNRGGRAVTLPDAVQALRTPQATGSAAA